MAEVAVGPRVLMVLPRLDVGGMETAVLAQARRLRTRGVEVHLATLAIGGPLAEAAATSALPVLMPPTPLRLRSAVRFLADAVQQCGAAVLHSHTGTWLPSAHAAWLAGVAHVHTRHGFVPGALSTASEFLAARATRHLLCVSDELWRHAQRVLRVPSSRGEVLANGVELDTLPPPPAVPPDGLPSFVMVCRLAAIKNVSLVLDALAHARQQLPGLSLTLIGDGPARAALEAQTARLQLTEVVRFLGMQPDPWGQLPGGAIFIQASDSEGLSLSLIEAMAMGCRVIATPVGQTAAFTAGSPGVLLVPPGDLEAMASAMVTMATTEQAEARTQSAGNRAHAVTRGGLAPVVDRLHRLYGSLTARAPIA